MGGIRVMSSKLTFAKSLKNSVICSMDASMIPSLLIVIYGDS